MARFYFLIILFISSCRFTSSESTISVIFHNRAEVVIDSIIMTGKIKILKPILPGDSVSLRLQEVKSKAESQRSGGIYK